MLAIVCPGRIRGPQLPRQGCLSGTLRTWSHVGLRRQRSRFDRLREVLQAGSPGPSNPPSCAALSTVPTPSFISRAIAFQPRPCARRLAILERFTTMVGRPRRLPLDRACRRPAFTRSWMSATAAEEDWPVAPLRISDGKKHRCHVCHLHVIPGLPAGSILGGQLREDGRWEHFRCR